MCEDPEYRKKLSAGRGSYPQNIGAVAEKLNVAVNTVKAYCRLGKIGCKTDGRWVITDEEVERFVESRKRKETKQ